MRVTVRMDTKVSLSDYGSSIWGGSDDEGTFASSSSLSTRSKISPKAKTKKLSTATNTSRSYVTPAYNDTPANGSRTRSLASTRHGPSPLSQSYKNESFSRWLADEATASSPAESNGLSTSFNDALSSLQGLSISSNPQSESNYYGSPADSESDEGAHTPGAMARLPVRRSTLRKSYTAAATDDGTTIHQGVQCRSCKVMPIIGYRYHCASCFSGADFCSNCERNGYSMQLETGHSASHMVIRLAVPLDTSQAVNALGATLAQTQQRLMEQVSSVSSRAVVRQPSKVQTFRTTVYSNKALLCSFCVTPILSGHRFLCANCPIVSETSLDGFNLCKTCEPHSLQCHDSTHFFIKVNPPAREVDNRSRIPLGERWQIQEMIKGGPLLPPLYAEVEQQDPLQPPTLGFRSRSANNLAIRVGDGMAVSDSNNALTRRFAKGGTEATRRAQEIEMLALRESQSRYIVPVDRLVHPCILCDNCFSVIHGAWYRCCHCTASFDLCDTCEPKISHDPSHSFAVFKQPVDLDLFKSCVDHQDAGEGLIGASRPMLSFSLL
jgi:hypothetical protein